MPTRRPLVGFSRAGLTVTLVAAVAALLLSTFTSSAAAATPSGTAGGHGIATAATPNWAGYVVESPRQFTAVTGSWTVPTTDCTGVTDPTANAVWVGLDGFLNQTVEQIGIKASCGATASYTAWWQMWPAPVNRLPISSYPVNPGDVLTATVSRTGQQYTLGLRSSAGWQFSTIQNGTAADSSAEWVASSPKRCATCQYVALGNFGTVHFSDARAATGPHLRGVESFTRRGESASAVSMVSADGVVRARPSRISTCAGGFDVIWKHA
jgi:hypothetical protein